jgi:hypothetical protein
LILIFFIGVLGSFISDMTIIRLYNLRPVQLLTIKQNVRVLAELEILKQYIIRVFPVR